MLTKEIIYDYGFNYHEKDPSQSIHVIFLTSSLHIDIL